MKKALLLSSFYIEGNQGSPRLNDFPNVMQLLYDRVDSKLGKVPSEAVQCNDPPESLSLTMDMQWCCLYYTRPPFP